MVADEATGEAEGGVESGAKDEEVATGNGAEVPRQP